MLTKEQAQAAADTLLAEKKAVQAAQAARLADSRRPFRVKKWAAIGGLAGLGLGSLLGYMFTGHLFPTGVALMAVGMLLGRFCDIRQT
jgi:hypothetical protein